MSWLTWYKYRKQITITWQANAGTNYQVKLIVWESSGSSGANFNVNWHSLSFPSAKNISWDLRFTASDWVTLQNFWVESVSWTTPNRIATIWIKISTDLWTNQNIYCYYNWDATNISNWNNTFLFFDDFDWTSIDTTKWTINNWSVTSYTNSEISWWTTGLYAVTSWKYTVNVGTNLWVAWRCEIRRDSNNTETAFRFIKTSSDVIQMWNTTYQSQWVYNYWAGIYNLSQISLWNNAAWDYIYDLKLNWTTLNWAQSSWLSGSRTLSSSIQNTTFYYGIVWWWTAYPGDWINFIAIRNYLINEPIFNSINIEEIAPTNNSNFFIFF